MAYFLKESTGLEGFITHQDNELAHIAGYPGDIWVTENTTWAQRVGAQELTKEEAQAIVDAAVSASNVPIPPYVEPVQIILP